MRDSEFSKRLRTMFNFIDNKLGIGMFIIFCSFIMMETESSGEVFFGIFNILVSLVNIYFGCNEETIAFPNNPFTDQANAGVDVKKEGDVRPEEAGNQVQ